MTLCYRNQMLFYSLMQQQNLLLEGLDLATAKPVDHEESRYGSMETGSRKHPSNILMTKPKKKFKSAAELSLNL